MLYLQLGSVGGGLLGVLQGGGSELAVGLGVGKGGLGLGSGLGGMGLGGISGDKPLVGLGELGLGAGKGGSGCGLDGWRLRGFYLLLVDCRKLIR